MFFEQRIRRDWLRLLLVLMTLLLLVSGGLWIVKQAWEDGPPLWWVLRGSRVEKISVQWGKEEIEFTEARKVQQFYQAVLAGSDPLPYGTKCLPDKPENWSVSLIRVGQSPFQVQVGIDTCGTFYVPQVGSTYHSNRLVTLIRESLKSASIDAAPR